MKNIILFAIAFALLLSCKKENEEVKTSGEVILSTQILGGEPNYYVQGFSFATAQILKYNKTSNTNPDLVPENNTQNEILGANIESPNNDKAFYKAGEFSTLTEAQTFFNTIKEAGSVVFEQKIYNVKANQVYLYKSRSDTYAKFLVKSTETMDGPLTDYVKITIEWVYQPDGSLIFP
ncbi:MAG: hypothetical protein HC905_23555 [Bacteroidales bacterium]|nr:hypothetical protein [Bacteroidales bacterium]